MSFHPRGKLRIVAMLLAASSAADLARAARTVLDVRLVADAGAAVASERLHLRATAESGGEVVEGSVAPGLEGELVVGDGAWVVWAEGQDVWAPRMSVVTAGEGRREVALPLFRAGLLRGRVVGAPRGEVPEALVLRGLWATPGRALAYPGVFESACTIERGEAFACAVPVGRLHVRLWAPGFVPQVRWNIEVSAQGATEWGNLELSPGATVRGLVLSGDRSPLDRRTRIELRPAAEPARTTEEERRVALLSLAATPGEGGAFEFHDLPPGRFRVRAEGATYHPAEVEVRVAGTRVVELPRPLVLTLPWAIDVVVDPPVDPAGRLWSLLVMQAGEVAAERPPGGMVDVAVSGNARLTELEQGRTYRVSLLDGDGGHWLEREIVAGAIASPLVLEARSLRLEGEITLGVDETPLAATVELVHAVERRRHSYRAGPDGRFSGALTSPGRWLVRVRAENPQVDFFAGPRELTSPPEGGPVMLRIAIEDGRAAGQVVDREDRPAAGATVELAAYDGLGPRVRARSDAEGRFEMRGLPLGSATLRASKGERSSRPETVEIREGEHPAEVTLRLLDRREMSVRVVSLAGPVPGATLTFRAESSRATGLAFESVTTGSDGEARISLPPEATAIAAFIDTPGFALDLKRVPVAQSTAVLPLSTSGGGLVLEDLQANAESVSVAWLLNSTGDAPVGLLEASSLRRGEPRTPGRLSLPIVVPGEYALCLLTPIEIGALVAGTAPANARCNAGVLQAGQSLVLRLPAAAP